MREPVSLRSPECNNTEYNVPLRVNLVFHVFAVFLSVDLREISLQLFPMGVIVSVCM